MPATAVLKMTVKELSKQPWDFGALYSYASPNLDGRGRLFVFNGERDFVEREFGGLEGVIQFEEEHCPGDFEFDIVNYGTEEESKYVFVKGHPYQSLVTLHRIEQAMPKSEKYELIPLRKYFGTNDTIVTELIFDPGCEFDGAHLFKFKEWYARGGFWHEPSDFDQLLEKARASEDGRNELRQFIVQSEYGGENWFESHAKMLSWCDASAYDINRLVSKKIRVVDVGEVLPFAEEALDALYMDLETAGRKLRMSHHVDPRPSNIFFRGINNRKFQFTLVDQYHCGDAEKSHHDRKYGGGPILRMGP